MFGEVAELAIAHPDDQKGPKFKNVGIANFELEIDPRVTVVPKADKSGWTLTMPVVKPAQPIRVRIFRIFKKNDAEFDLRFDRKDDGPALRTRTSYLDSDIFVVVRDFLLDVADIPPLPDALTDWNKTFDLVLPLRLAKGVKPVIVPQKADSPAPKLERTGDDGRGEKWQVGPLKDALGEDAVYDVTVAFGSVGAPIVRKFKLTLAAQITITSATAEVIPGRPLELTIARGTPPYTIKLTGEPKGMTATQPSATTVILLALGAPDADKEARIIVKDSSNPKLESGRHFMVRAMPPYLLPDASPKYFDYILPPTFGMAVPLINGRSSGGAGADIDLTEPLDAMERAVAALGAGDSVYLSAWFFEPATVLTVGGIAGVATWGELFARKARDGVKIRLLINDFDSITGMDAWLNNAGLAPLDTLIAALPAGKRDNLKYLVCMHPAQVGKIKTALAGKGFKNTNVGSHHQKFMIVRKGDSLTAFCGGLDIESRKTPPTWSYAGLTGWHDIHVQLDGPITRDLEREFIERWNRDAAHSTRPARPGWAAMEVLTGTALSPVDDTPAKKLHSLQMMRTITDDGTVSLFDNKRNDIALMYERAITRAKSFIYMENQYFRSTDLADWVVGAAKKNPSLVVIMAVVTSAGADDGKNLVTEHGDFLQFETFERIAKGLGARAGFFTMTGRAVHSKFLLVDDAWMTIGSANANVRSFKLDSELNVQIGEAALAKAFRHRLWAHNLGQLEPTVAGWTTGDFLAQWRSVAAANRGLGAEEMAGEGVVAYDYTLNQGSKSMLVPDALVEIDLGGEEADQNRIA